jgi:hypothetical protein
MMQSQKLSSLLSIPLQAAIRAQASASLEAVNVVRSLTDREGYIPNLNFRVVRTIDETVKDEDTGSLRRVSVQRPVEVAVPLLALTGASGLQISDMSVRMGVHIDRERDPENGEILGRISKFSDLDSQPDMQIEMKITREVGEGMAQLVTLMNDMIGRVPERE